MHFINKVVVETGTITIKDPVRSKSPSTGAGYVVSIDTR